MNGRYGPYVKYGDINATIPKDRDPEAVTMEEALESLAVQASKAGKTKKAKTTRTTDKIPLVPPEVSNPESSRPPSRLTIKSRGKES
ncbi:MAG: hypothetical protein OHK0012_09270 [Synechococcales cyanobacterium]